MHRMLPWVLIALVAGGAAPPCPPADGESPPHAQPLEAGFNAFPPCIEVEWTPVALQGRPPLTITWKVDGQVVATGMSWIMDTTDYFGFHTVAATVTNAWGSATASSFFVIDTLSVPALAATQNPTPGLAATVFTATPMRGATEWQISWGDGTATPWSCDFSDPTLTTTHTYPQPGTYSARLRGRNCRDPVMQGTILQLTVGDPDAIQVTLFQVQGCEFGFCVFDAGEPLTFDQAFSAVPTELRYDWQGDGTVDQVSTSPITVHAYAQGGVYRPVLTALRGANQHTRQHQDFILINETGSTPVFEDGFESGDLSAWSASTGLGPSPVSVRRGD